MRLVLILGILCIGVSILGLTRKRPYTAPYEELGPCGFSAKEYAEGSCRAGISCWSVEKGHWKQQPILVVNGKTYTHPTPQGYLNDLRAIRKQPYCMYNPDGKWGKWVLMVDIGSWDQTIRKMEATEF